MSYQTDQILLSICIVKQRRIESRTVKINRIRPRSFDIFCRDQIVLAVHKFIPVCTDIRIDQIISPLIIRKARSKDAARRIISPHIKLACSFQWSCYKFPVLQITGMINTYARKPFKRRYRDIVVFFHTDNGRIRMKSRQNRIYDCFHFLVSTFLSFLQLLPPYRTVSYLTSIHIQE